MPQAVIHTVSVLPNLGLGHDIQNLEGLVLRKVEGSSSEVGLGRKVDSYVAFLAQEQRFVQIGIILLDGVVRDPYRRSVHPHIEVLGTEGRESSAATHLRLLVLVLHVGRRE